MDYHVVLDISVASIPVWILTSNVQLKEHERREGADVPQLPIFRRLIRSTWWGYTAACILSSVYQLSDDPSEQPDFEKELRIADKTRSGSDPRTLRVSKEMEAEILDDAYYEETWNVFEAFRAAEEGRSYVTPMSDLHLDLPWGRKSQNWSSAMERLSTTRPQTSFLREQRCFIMCRCRHTKPRDNDSPHVGIGIWEDLSDAQMIT